MRTILFFFAILPLSAGTDPSAARSAAAAAARVGDWRGAELYQREALRACHRCTVEDLALLRSELATFLTLGGFPEAAIPLCQRSIAELPLGSPLRAASYLGLGVAYHAARRVNDARKAWNLACESSASGTLEHAACRFNIAVAQMDATTWSEVERLLPVLLTVEGPVSRATILIHAARAAVLAKKPGRAVSLLDRADAELNDTHPFRAQIFMARAEVASLQGDRKQSNLWRKKARKLPQKSGWERATVSLDELKGKR
jgi:hypothetical protein